MSPRPPSATFTTDSYADTDEQLSRLTTNNLECNPESHCPLLQSECHLYDHSIHCLRLHHHPSHLLCDYPENQAKGESCGLTLTYYLHQSPERYSKSFLHCIVSVDKRMQSRTDTDTACPDQGQTDTRLLLDVRLTSSHMEIISDTDTICIRA